MPPFTVMWWSGSRDISVSGSKLRDMNGTCIIILVKKYNIANSLCHFGPYDPQCHELFAIYWNIKRSYTLLSTIYCIGDFKIVSISVFVLANFFIFLFLLFYLCFFIFGSPPFLKNLFLRGYCFYLYVFVFDLIFLVCFIYNLTVLYSVSRNFLTPVSKIYITYYFCYFTINERLLLKYVYYKHDCLKIFQCPGSTIDNIVASSMLIPVRVKPKTIKLTFAAPPLSMQNWE